jgi:hypothetical protein
MRNTFWRPDLPGPRLWCCGQWVAITRLPVHAPCCGRVWLVRRAVDVPKADRPWMPVPLKERAYVYV